MKRVLYGAGSLAWMGVIFFASTGSGSTENTRPLVAVLVDWLRPGLAVELGPTTLGMIDWCMRKAAHVTEYFLLTGLLLGALSDPKARTGRSWVAWCAAVAYAMTDELHQALVPGRHATWGDIGWDAGGAGLAVILHRIRTRWSK